MHENKLEPGKYRLTFHLQRHSNVCASVNIVTIEVCLSGVPFKLTRKDALNYVCYLMEWPKDNLAYLVSFERID